MTTTTRHSIAKRVMTVYEPSSTGSHATGRETNVSLPAEPWPQDASYQPRDETKPSSLPIRVDIDPDTARRRITNDLGLRRCGA